MADEKHRDPETVPEAASMKEQETDSSAPDYLEEPGPRLDSDAEEETQEPEEESYSSVDFGGDSADERLGRCKARVRQLEAEIQSLKETLLRKMAEFENLKKRTSREKDEAVRYGTASILTSMLEVLDNFDRALAVEPDSADTHSFYEGMKLIARHLQEILRAQGLSEVDPAGEPFDPFFHEAMMRRETDEVPDNTVLEVFQKGYKLKDRLLRPARVMVATRPVPADAADATPAEQTDEPAPEAKEEGDE